MLIARASFFLLAAEAMARLAHAKLAADLELGHFGDGVQASNAIEGGGRVLSIVVHSLSFFILVPSVMAFLDPFSNSPTLGHAMGAAGVIIGLYLALFSDQLVTYARLWRQVHYLHDNQKIMGSELARQKRDIEHLHAGQKALDCADKFLTENGETIWDRISHSMATMTRTTKASTRHIVEAHLIFLEDENGNIRGQGMVNAFMHVFQNMCVRYVQDAQQRFGEMTRGLIVSRRWQEHGSLPCNVFPLIVEVALFADNIAEIADKAMAIADAHLTAEGKLADADDLSTSEAAAVRNELRAVDSWASAEAFAFGTGGQ